MTSVQTFDIPGLATVKIDQPRERWATVTVMLDPVYLGDLNQANDPRYLDKEHLTLQRLAQDSPGPLNQLLKCDVMGAFNNPALARFMEVLDHWDYTGDDVPDCDDIMKAIDDALPLTDEQPKPFHRPNSGVYARALMRIMPPQPVRHIVMGFGQLKPRFRWFHHAAALPMLAGVLGLIMLQEHFLPWTKYSVISGIGAIGQSLGLAWWIGLLAFFVGYVLLVGFRKRSAGSPAMSPHTYGFFNRAAVYEEQAFREGSEDWTLWERARSCFAFGALHMVNLWYPLATIVPLALGGGMFMFFYLRKYRQEDQVQPRVVRGDMHIRRMAVLESSIWHRVYNRMALISVAVSLVFALGYELLQVLGVFGLAIGASALWSRLQNRTSPVAVPAPTASVVGNV